MWTRYAGHCGALKGKREAGKKQGKRGMGRGVWGAAAG